MSKSDPARAPRRARTILAGAVLFGALVGVIISALGGQFQRWLVFDSWQQIAPVEQADSAIGDMIVVVLIDEKSVAAAGQWPWPRIDVAQLINRISAASPAAIGIDIYFPEEDPLRPAAFTRNYLDSELDPATRDRLLALPSMDVALARQIAGSTSVVARAASEGGGRPAADIAFDQVDGTPPPATARTERVLTSIAMIDEAAHARGFVNGSPDADGIVRRVPLAIVAGESVGNGFAVELARIWADDADLRWQGRTLIMGDRRIPADESGAMLFRMGHYPDAEAMSAIDLFDSGFDPRRLQGKIVILGVSATGTGDIVATPIASEVLGPYVQAQAVSAIIAGNWLSRPAWAPLLETVLAAVAVALLLGAAATPNSRFAYAAIVLITALPAASFLAFDLAHLLIDPARPLIVAICAGIGLLMARYALTLIELVEKRVFAAEQEKENQSARALQLTMVPSARRLSTLGRRTAIGAVLEPARSVGGDFYDAMELGEDRLAFLVGDVSGKGLRAALFMALSKTVSRNNLMRIGENLEQAIRSVNDDLMAEEDQEMDLTLLAGIIDCATGHVQLVNAGHEDPLLLRADGRVDHVTMKGGPRLRTLEGFPYTSEHLQLAQGETLVIVTDGATDASNIAGDRFGLDRVIESLRRHPGAAAPQLVRIIAGDVRAFEKGTDPADDLTILALRYIGDDDPALGPS